MDGFFIAKLKKFSNAIPKTQKGKPRTEALLSCPSLLSQAASHAETTWVLPTALFCFVSDEEPAVEAANPPTGPETVMEPQAKKKKLEGSKVAEEQKKPQPTLKKRHSLQGQRRPLKAVRASNHKSHAQVPNRKKHRVKQKGQ